MNDFRGFIVHNYNLVDRKNYLKLQLGSDNSFTFIEIENQEPSYGNEKYFGVDALSWKKKTKNLWTPIPSPRPLSLGEIACTASHFYIYEKYLKECSEEWLVVIEDDAVFDCDLSNEIQKLISEEVPDRVDAIFIGGGYPHNDVSLTIGGYKNFFIKHHPATNTTVGYMMRRKMVTAIMDGFETFDLPIDYELAYLLMANNALVMHIHPYLISEGSKSLYLSSIRS